MITKGSRGNNEPGEVIHRFHKRESCVFHSIHRLPTSLRNARRSEGGPAGSVIRLEGAIRARDITLSRGVVGCMHHRSIDTAETARI